DGGNSKTDVVIGTGTGEVLAYVGGPGTCHQNIGLAETMRRLRDLVSRARGQARYDSDFIPAGIFLAGPDPPPEGDLPHSVIADEGWTSQLLIDNDTFAVLRAGSDAPDAIAVVCGAGINCVGRAAGGQTARFPALGQLTGDWGGGDHLGSLAMWHAI